MQKFDRNNFLDFVNEHNQNIKKHCSLIHSEYVKNIYVNVEHRYSFRNISNEELSNYNLIGNLRDEKIKELTYLEFNNRFGEYWDPEAKIAINFYPYHVCDIYECKECRRLFLVYTEYAGHGPQQRIRNIKPELIIEEPTNFRVNLDKSMYEKLLIFVDSIINVNDKIIVENSKRERVNTNFNLNTIIINNVIEDDYLIVGRRELIYKILEFLNE